MTRRWALVATLASLVLITVATNTTASLAQPQVGAEFGAGPADTGWIVFGYSATFAVATALFGGVASRIGLTPALVAGVSLLGLGSLAAAVAPSLELLIASRLLQGLGSGAIPTLSTALIAGRFQGRERGQALGVIVASVGAGQAAGPIIGGLLLDLIGWRAAVSIGIVAVPAVVMLQLTQGGRDDRGPRRAFDAPGAGLVAVVALGLALVLNRGPVLGVTAITVVPAVAVALAALALVRRTSRVPDGFVPRAVVADRTFRRVVTLGAIGMSAYIGTIVSVPILAARVYGLDGIPLGLVLLPMAVAAGIASPSSAWVEARIGRVWTTRLSLAALGIGALALALGAQTVGLVVALPALASLGLGFGLLNPPLLNELTHAFENERQPLAVGIYNLCFFLGGAIGAAVTSAIVQAGLALPLLPSGPLPGFVTAQLLVAAVPLAALLLMPGEPRPAATGVG